MKFPAQYYVNYAGDDREVRANKLAYSLLHTNPPFDDSQELRRLVLAHSSKQCRCVDAETGRSCTRVVGHTGPHIATRALPAAVMAVWPNSTDTSLADVNLKELMMSELQKMILPNVTDSEAPPLEVTVAYTTPSWAVVQAASHQVALYRHATSKVVIPSTGWDAGKLIKLLTHFSYLPDQKIKDLVKQPTKTATLPPDLSRTEARLFHQILERPWKVLPQTQKAKGMQALAEWLNKGAGSYPAFALAQEDEDIPLSLEFPRFVRPCPPTPNHGGVESRIVTSIEAVKEVLAEAQAAVPGSEIIIAEPIEAVANLVYTPTVLTLGPGHDGATAGKGARALGLVRTESLGVLPLVESGITDEPYVEAVLSRDSANRLKVLWTQLRNGPVLQAVQDYVPVETTVVRVVEADGDLLEWAVKVNGFEPGTVVHGSGMGSHYAVHCIQKGVPFVTTHTPVVGEVLPKSDITPLNPQSVREGLILAQKARLNGREDAKSALKLGLLALHAFAPAPEMGLNGLAVGYGLGVMMRTAFALGCGEWRYCTTQGELFYGEAVVPITPAPWKGKSRDTAYKTFLSKSWSAQRAHAIEATAAFRFGSFSSGYGGQKWHDCMRSTWKIESAARKVIKHPCKETVDELLTHANIMIHKAHNGGWWFNKLLSTSDLNLAAAADPTLVVNMSGAVWEMLEHQLRLTPKQRTVSGWPTMVKVEQHLLDWKPAPKPAVEAPPLPVVPTWDDYRVEAQVRVKGIGLRLHLRLTQRSNGTQFYCQENDITAAPSQLEWVAAQEHSAVSFFSSVMYVPLSITGGATLGTLDMSAMHEGMPEDLTELLSKEFSEMHAPYLNPTTGLFKEPSNDTSSAQQEASYYQEEGEWAYV